jgi:hypothetical protein
MDASAAKLAGPVLLDLENMDLSAMFVQSPYMLPLGVSTPTSSERSHSDSGSSDLSYFPAHDDMAFQIDREAMDDLFLPTSSNDGYYPVSSSMAPHQMYYSSAETYSHYSQQQWQGLPIFGQQTVSSSGEEVRSSSFSTFDMPAYGSGGSFIPPTPQSLYPFQATSPQPQEGYLSPQGPHSSARPIHYSHSRSASSISRSCTPNLDPTQPSSAPSNYSQDSNPESSSASSSLLSYGVPVQQSGMSASQTWRCAYPGCTSRALFTRGCDLRKHFNRHSKHLFCRVEGCLQSEACAVGEPGGRRGSVSGTGGFSSKKDRARHEAKHNPGIRCEWRGSEGEECGRVFSRMDNMKDHVRRIHRKGSR